MDKKNKNGKANGKRTIEEGVRLMLTMLTDPDPLIRKRACMGLESIKDCVPLLDLLSIRLYRRWKSWKRAKPGRDYAWVAMRLVMHMATLAHEKRAGEKIMAMQRWLWERETGETIEAQIQRIMTLL